MTFSLRRSAWSVAVGLLLAVPTSAQTVPANSTTEACQTTALAAYQQGNSQALTAFGEAILRQAQRQAELTAQSGRTAAIRASRARSFSRARTQLERALTSFVQDRNRQDAQDASGLDNFSTLEPDQADQALEAFTDQDIDQRTFDRALQAMATSLRLNANTQYRTLIRDTWNQARANAWEQLIVTTQTVRETFADDIRNCAGDELGDTPNVNSDSENTAANNETTTAAPSANNQSATTPAFNIDSATVDTHSSDATRCDAAFLSVATLESNGTGTVRYVWQRSDGLVAPVESTTFTAAGTKTITLKWRPNINASNNYSGWAQIRIISPNLLTSDPAGFTATCQAARPNTSVTTPTAAATSESDLRLTASVAPPSGNTCPQTFTFNGSITANRAGRIQYTWDRSDGALGPIYTLTFDRAGTQAAQTNTWFINRNYDGWQRLHVLSPVDRTSAEARISLTCNGSEPIARVTDVRLEVTPPTANVPACTQTFDFAGAITSDRPGTVRYTWDWSDGSRSAERTVEFEQAGTRTVHETWSLTKPLTGWARLHVLRPNDTSTERVNFSLSCNPAPIVNQPSTPPSNTGHEEPGVPPPPIANAPTTIVNSTPLTPPANTNPPTTPTPPVANAPATPTTIVNPTPPAPSANSNPPTTPTTPVANAPTTTITPTPPSANSTPTAPAATDPNAFRVTEANLKVDQAQVAVCGGFVFAFTGQVTVNRAGTVRYRWERSDNSLSPESSLEFVTAGTQTVTRTWYLGKAYEGFYVLHILSPNDLSSERASFKLTQNCPPPATETTTANPTTTVNSTTPNQTAANQPTTNQTTTPNANSNTNAATVDPSGSWNDNLGRTLLSLEKSGGFVGTFTNEQRNQSGAVRATRNGLTLTGTLTLNNTPGNFSWTLDPSGQTFIGQYNGAVWCGARPNATPTPNCTLYRP